MIWMYLLSWDVLLDAFRRPRRRLERVAFLDGVAEVGYSVVTTVTERSPPMTYSDRHEGDLAGKLRPFGKASAGVVVVRVEEQQADSAAAQHTVWMLTNLLCRLEGLVKEVVLDIPDGVALRSNVI